MSIRPSTKTKKAHDKAAEWLKQMGADAAAVAAARETTVQTKEEISLEAEAVLAFLEKPTRFVIYKCKRCGDSFGTNYRYNRYCSDTCRAKSLRDMGIEWDQHADAKQRWSGEPPLTIPAAAIQSLLAAAQVAQSQSDSERIPESRNQTDSQSAQAFAPRQASVPDTVVRTPPRENPETKTSGARTSLDFSLPQLSGF